MNKLLERQVRKTFGDLAKVPQNLLPFLELVSQAYDGFEEDRDLMERSLELSSQELIDTNKRLREEAKTQKAIVASLRNATSALRPKENSSKEWLTTREEAIYLAASLSKLIEEEKQYEKQLEFAKTKAEQEKAKAEAILESIGDGVFVVDCNGKIMLMNAVACNLSGFTLEEAQGRPYREIFKFALEKDPKAAYPPFIEDVIKTGTVKKLANHTLLIRKDQTRIPISDSAAPVRDEKGDIFGCIVVVRDASRERALERAKDEFISIAARQLRTPLSSMLWNVEMILQQGELPAQIREKLEHVNQDNQRLITLVNDLLNISRIDQGRVENEPEPIDISQAIQAVVQKMSAEAQKQQVAIELQLDEYVPRIMIDSKRFREVIENLLSNAVKYNVPGGRVIIGVAPAGEYIRISVADSGIGIPKEDHSRVFSKFYRGENVVVTRATGSGLGLFIVKSYVDEWGGKVSFESPAFAQKTPDGKVQYKGTTFYIDLPTGKV